MDLTILQKVNELTEQGRSAEEIKRELLTQGISPDTINEALSETGALQNTSQSTAPSAPATSIIHREKVIQPSPGFDPTAK